MACDTDTVFETIAAAISSALQRASISETRAAEIGHDAAEMVCRNLGGQTLYIPIRQRQRLRQRDEEIFRAFQGNNAAELSERYGLTKTRIYQILAAARRRRRVTGAAPGVELPAPQ